MDFYTVLEHEDGYSVNPYAAKQEIDGAVVWYEGTISIDHLNTHFGQYNTAAEMISATTSEGLQLYFGWLKEQGILN